MKRIQDTRWRWKGMAGVPEEGSDTQRGVGERGELHRRSLTVAVKTTARQGGSNTAGTIGELGDEGAEEKEEEACKRGKPPDEGVQDV